MKIITNKCADKTVGVTDVAFEKRIKKFPKTGFFVPVRPVGNLATSPPHASYTHPDRKPSRPGVWTSSRTPCSRRPGRPRPGPMWNDRGRTPSSCARAAVARTRTGLPARNERLPGRRRGRRLQRRQIRREVVSVSRETTTRKPITWSWSPDVEPNLTYPPDPRVHDVNVTPRNRSSNIYFCCQTRTRTFCAPGHFLPPFDIFSFRIKYTNRHVSCTMSMPKCIRTRI